MLGAVLVFWLLVLSKRARQNNPSTMCSVTTLFRKWRAWRWCVSSQCRRRRHWSCTVVLRTMNGVFVVITTIPRRLLNVLQTFRQCCSYVLMRAACHGSVLAPDLAVKYSVVMMCLVQPVLLFSKWCIFMFIFFNLMRNSALKCKGTP